MSDFFKYVDQKVINAWHDALDKSMFNTIFITPEWQSIWYKRFALEKAINVKVIKQNDEILGIVPIMISERKLTFIGDHNLYDYMDFPMVAEKEDRFFNLAWKYLRELDWDEMRLNSIPESSPTLQHLIPLVQDIGYDVEVIESAKTPLATLNTDWVTYIANLPKKYRHELKRKIRRLESNYEYSQFEAIITDDNVEEIMEEFFALMSSSKESKETFLIHQNKLFFTDLARVLNKGNQFKLFFMEIENKKVAACICFDYGNKYLLYNSGYDPEFSEFSVSLINKALSIKTAIEEGKSEFNFLKGIERYKYHLGASDYAVFDIMIRR